MRGNWPEEIVRLLENWSMWVANDRKPVSPIGSFPAYKMAARGPRFGNVIPILGIEAEKSDRIISNMAPRYQQPLRLHYLWVTRSDRNKAASCNCAIETYKSRLNEAHALFAAEWYGHRPRAAQFCSRA